MKRFLYKIVFLLLPILIGMFLLEFGLRKIPNDYSFKNEFYLSKRASEIEVLFMGSSHAYYGVNPEFITSRKSFNGAHYGQALEFDLAILEKNINKFSNLEFLVIPIDYLTLFPRGQSKNYLKNYKIYYELDNIEGDFFSINYEVFNGVMNNKFTQLIDYIVYNENNITCNEVGWGTTYESTDEKKLVESGRLRSKSHTVVKSNEKGVVNFNETYFLKNIEHLNELVSISKIKHFKILFYTSPAYYTYRDNLNKYQLNTTIDTVKTITNKNNNLFYHNFFDDNTFVEDDFWDATHLNELGAKKLTVKLDSILNCIENKY